MLKLLEYRFLNKIYQIFDDLSYIIDYRKSIKEEKIKNVWKIKE